MTGYANYKFPDDVFSRPAAIYESHYKCKVIGRTYIIDDCLMQIFKSERRDFPAQKDYRISKYKEAGILCFWVRKLKPFSVPTNEEANRYVNETIALYSGIYLVMGCNKMDGSESKLNLDGNFIHDLIVSLRYNSFSPHSTAYLFESLFK